MLIRLIFLVFFAFTNCHIFSQTISCEIVPEFIKLRQGEKRREIVGIDSNQILISFFNGFKGDSVLVYQNKKLVKTLVLKSSDNGHTKQSLILKRRKRGDKLKIINLTRSTCFEMPIQSGYKMLAVTIVGSQWKVIYSNYYFTVE